MTTPNQVLALITARGGSKGLPRKNILPLADKPLIAWTIEAALTSSVLDRVILSTDDPEIAGVARDWGCEVPFTRPTELSQDKSNHISVVLHALDWLADHENYHPTHLLLLQPTSPLRTADDIRQAVDLSKKTNAPAVVGVCLTTSHPYLTKQIAADGTLTDFVKPPSDYLPRQSLPPAYVINGAIYLNTVTSLRGNTTFFPLGTRPYIMPADRSLDIDTNLQFQIADFLLRSKIAP